MQALVVENAANCRIFAFWTRLLNNRVNQLVMPIHPIVSRVQWLSVGAQHDVDDGVDVSHIDHAAAIDVGPALIVAGLVGAQQDVDEDVDILHVYLAVQVDITRQPGCPASAAATIIIRMISLRM